MLPEEIFERRNCLVTNFPGKCEKNDKAILKTYELFIYAYVHHIGKSFCEKYAHWQHINELYSRICQHLNIKNIQIFINIASIVYF